MQNALKPLPNWSVDRWFNTPKPLSLKDLRGKVVVIEAFQMLCPGCVAHGVPLAQQVHEAFPAEDVAVIGLHTVFEHHAAMTPVSLKAFLHEYRITFPVGVDKPGKAALPETMERYGLRGTPSLLLLDRKGGLVAHHFGQVSALKLGSEITSLIIGESAARHERREPGLDLCGDTGCVI
ncbi:MAG: redoxin domain-containing protein [Thalassovita sp.]